MSHLEENKLNITRAEIFKDSRVPRVHPSMCGRGQKMGIWSTMSNLQTDQQLPSVGSESAQFEDTSWRSFELLSMLNSCMLERF